MSGVSSATIISGLTAASGVINTVGAITQGNARGNAADYNANMADQNDNNVNTQTQQQLQQQQRDAYKRLSAIKAGYGASGVGADSGSALDVLADSFTQASMDADTIATNGRLKAQGYRSTAALDRSEAGNDRTAGYINGASAALLGATNAYKAYDTVGTND